MVFNDKCLIVNFIRKGKIPTNIWDSVQQISQDRVPENIDIKNMWFMTDLKNDPIKVSNDKPLVSAVYHVSFNC